LFCCIDFPDEWSGIRFRDQWTPENSGGTPIKPDPQLMESWAKNPQFVIQLNTKKFKSGKNTTKIFISLGQPDGRLIRGLKFPFKENINPVCFTVARLSKGEQKLSKFDPARVVKVSAVKEYREVALELELENGNYVVVPSTQLPGQTGEFFLNIYFECDIPEIKLFNADTKKEGEIIAEEDETVTKTDAELKTILKIKYIIFNNFSNFLGLLPPWLMKKKVFLIRVWLLTRGT